ncbi:hypothetical protein DICPUDRAFT_92369 [Dictyostelium purpureum]|uniref:Uncharacterized protein n=1 Tax=Dictyostelium purpureum TaxID=5786 RepID=F0ZQS7_DICPU|nr:uncharacterized protein DICPUDRAFT_92369 [Dictyostelium purpureum]EGC33704.1 hypothetical protein DICPUDRAFT_92369 [Dictyostelium purpureum]|eukprot:XP_003289781.1 hypothetical protein DICPUDRAFT_92369 [Dictyostelium purpureum]
MACYMENQEIIDYILDSIHETGQYVSDNNNSDIRILLAQGSDYSIIEKILATKLKYQNSGEHQRFIPETFIIAFVNGHIKTGELFIRSKYINWNVNQIDPTCIAPILYHCREELITEFLFKNKCLSDLFNFFTKTTVADFSILLSSFSHKDTISMFLAYYCITLRNNSLHHSSESSNNNLKLQFYLGDFFFNILKVLVFQCDLDTLKKLCNIELFNRHFNWDLFVWSIQFQNLPIISFLFNKVYDYIEQNQKVYQLSDLIEDYYDNKNLKELFNNLKKSIRNKKKKIKK